MLRATLRGAGSPRGVHTRHNTTPRGRSNQKQCFKRYHLEDAHRFVHVHLSILDDRTVLHAPQAVGLVRLEVPIVPAETYTCFVKTGSTPSANTRYGSHSMRNLSYRNINMYIYIYIYIYILSAYDYGHA